MNPQRIVSFFLLFFFIHGLAIAQKVTDQIKLNQIGFYPDAGKIAVVTGNVNPGPFYVTSTNLRDTFFRGTLGEENQSLYSSTKTRIADFSALQKRGSFVVLIPGVGHSYVFRIGDEVHRAAAKASLKAFYYHRMSMPVEEKYGGKWHRSAGHPDNMVYIHPSAASKERPAGTIISSPGGWYDAGDYNKYIVNSGITMGTLFSAYEDFPLYYKALSLNIPESGDAVPDILDEVIYNLRWMLTMQDPFDGGVYHKCTNAAFDGMVMPGITTLPRYVVQKGTAASLDFAAVTAQASRILKPFAKQFPGLSDSCLKGAQRAWAWAQKAPAVEYNQNALNKVHDPDITTGAYGDRSFKDEWFWAAAELFATTGNKTYYDTVSKRLEENFDLPTWNNVGFLGYYSLIRLQKKLPPYVQKDIEAMKQRVVHLADTYLSNVNKNAFRTVMGQTVKDFIWGGNSVAANQGIVLLNAYFLTGNKNYIAYAVTNLDYIFGRNATGYSFLTGYGSKSTMHPHHRPSVADGIIEPVPGFLAGGPNPGRQDSCRYEFTEPETAYTDHDCSYASNEIAINWNAPMAYLANAIEALKKEEKKSVPKKEMAIKDARSLR